MLGGLFRGRLPLMVGHRDTWPWAARARVVELGMVAMPLELCVGAGCNFITMPSILLVPQASVAASSDGGQARPLLNVPD